MAWRMDRDGAAIYEPFSKDDLACRDEEIKWLDDRRKPWKLVNGLIEGMAAANARAWKGVLGEIEAQGDPTALVGFTGVEVTPPVLTLPTITMGATELSLWAVPTFTPIAASMQAPKAYVLRSWGTATTAATQGSILFNARMGQLVSSPILGSSVTAVQTASQTTTNFMLHGDVLIQSGGGATTGKAVGSFRYSQATATTGGGPELAACNQIFGSTAQVSVETDAALANGLWMGGIATTSTTNTFIPLAVIWASWN